MMNKMKDRSARISERNSEREPRRRDKEGRERDRQQPTIMMSALCIAQQGKRLGGFILKRLAKQIPAKKGEGGRKK